MAKMANMTFDDLKIVTTFDSIVMFSQMLRDFRKHCRKYSHSSSIVSDSTYRSWSIAYSSIIFLQEFNSTIIKSN